MRCAASGVHGWILGAPGWTRCLDSAASMPSPVLSIAPTLGGRVRRTQSGLRRRPLTYTLPPNAGPNDGDRHCADETYPRSGLRVSGAGCGDAGGVSPARWTSLAPPSEAGLRSASQFPGAVGVLTSTVTVAGLQPNRRRQYGRDLRDRRDHEALHLTQVASPTAAGRTAVDLYPDRRQRRLRGRNAGGKRGADRHIPAEVQFGYGRRPGRHVHSLRHDQRRVVVLPARHVGHLWPGDRTASSICRHADVLGPITNNCLSGQPAAPPRRACDTHSNRGQWPVTCH